jgi:hemin uptake protein HemP
MLVFTSDMTIETLGSLEDLSLTTIMITIIVTVNSNMNTEQKPRVSEPQRAPQRVASASLLGANRELVIVHNGREYRLRLTQNDKLILTA